jgi:3-deoxy-D-manno-octulosonic-acid transferase
MNEAGRGDGSAGEARRGQPGWRALYWLATHAVAPFVVLLEAWRELRGVEQRGRLRGRVGFAPTSGAAGGLWLHAVSVGEVQASAALLREMRQRVPGLAVTITTVTTTGARRARELFGDDVQYAFLPYDLPGAVRRFLDRVRPAAVVMVETEIWPALYGELASRGIPLTIASARLSERSVRRYRRVAPLIGAALAGDVVVGAQTEEDASRFRTVGCPAGQVQVTGNVKFDQTIPETVVESGRGLRRGWGDARPVWIAGSTHEGEESAALGAHAIVRRTHPHALLVLVPRHPQRFATVTSLLAGSGLPYSRRSAGSLPSAADAVYLADTVGELQMLYAACDVAFVGGSLVPVGGHSLIEPASLGLPVLCGPHTRNTAEAAELLEQAGALTIVHDAEDLGRRVSGLFDDPAQARHVGALGRAAVAASRGAVLRTVALLLPRLSRSVSVSSARSGTSGTR